ncbi:TonB-dependent receptor domain-containing protein [Mucilaginibacter sp. NFX135]|uniref:TonB-dependent receptor domain-containing protein n=1 Tax=Mucilaginibacter sp. NFX135 TaxID=3402687 RepID=UPI003AFA06B1
MRIKLITALLFAVCLHLSAASFSQSITLTEKNASLESVLNKIEQQSGYDIFMQTELLAGSNKVSIDIKAQPLIKVLEKVFKGQPITYAIVGHTIVVKEKTSGKPVSTGNQAMLASVYTGKVVDAETKEPLIGASVGVKGGGKATSTGLNGDFKLKLDDNDTKTLVISYIGYVTQEVEITGKNDLGPILLKSSANAMKEVVVTGDLAIDRKTPIAVSTINQQFIEEKLGGRDIPQLLQSTPGIMATAQGGGYGDARVSIRGFSSGSKKGNVALTINGIPVNDMENGSVFWSNWSGLTDVTNSVQIQRGLGASKIIIPSFGGTINITTRTTEAEKGGYISQTIGTNNYEKTAVLVATGLNANGWAATFQGSRTKGDGYADGLNFLGYNYFFNLSKVLSPSQTLSFTVMGATQTHGQRPERPLTEYAGAPQGIKWNYDLGVKDGKQINPYNNFFSKPVFSLNHNWIINEKSSLSTVLYATYGTGGGGAIGASATGTAVPPRVSNLYSPFDFDAVQKSNAANPDGSALTYLYAAHNDHAWYGLRSTYTTTLGQYLNLSAGLDLRYYKGTHYEEVKDLLGADYVYDPYTATKVAGSRSGDINNPNHRAVVGDKIDYYNKDYVMSGGAYAQAEYAKNDFSAFITLSGSGTGDKRVDLYNYLNSDPAQASRYVNFLSYQAKAGANYNLNNQMNIFANIGYITKPPYFDNVFQKFTNSINTGTVDEKLFSYELGYQFKTSGFVAKLNLYRSLYMDQSFTNPYTDNTTNQIYNVNVSGVNEMHQGAELELSYQPIKAVTLHGMFSYGDWYYTKNAGPATVYNDQHQALTTIKEVLIKGIKVGDAAQTTAAFGLDIKVLPELKLGTNYYFYGNYYSSFNFANITNPGVQPYKVPNYSVWDLNASFKFKIAGLDATLNGNVNNLLNTKYIADGYDPAGTGLPANLSVYYGLLRTFTTGIKVKF